MRSRAAALAFGLVAGASAAHAAPTFAVWSVTGGGSSGSAATTMPAGTSPTAAATGASVTVRWAAAHLASGTSVAGYVIHRYSVNGTSVPVGGSCAGTVTTTTCSEVVASGSWFYTDTPVQASWTGGESPAGNTVSVP